MFQQTQFSEGSIESTDVNAALAAAKLQFKVGAKPIFIEDESSLGGIRQVDGQRAIVRLDNSQVFAVMSDGYTIVQNDAGLAPIQEVIDAGEARIISAGYVGGGRKVYIQAQITGAQADVTPGDSIFQSVVFANGHDGSLACSFGYTQIRVVCQNTMMGAARSASFRAKHTAGVHRALSAAKAEFTEQRQAVRLAAERFRELTKRKLSDKNLVRYVRETLAPGAGNDDQIKVKGVDRIIQLAHEAPGAEPGTMWGGLNAVTYWATHERGRSENARRESLMFGQGGALIDRATEVAFQYADKLPLNDLARECYANSATASAEFSALLGGAYVSPEA